MKINFSKDKDFVNSYLHYLLTSQDSLSENSSQAITTVLPSFIKEYWKANDKEAFFKKQMNIYWEQNDCDFSLYSQNLQKEWLKYEKNIIIALESIFDTKLTEDINIYVYNFHWYPRFLDTQGMIVSSSDPIYFSISTIIHEITHFFYFKKWSELFPNDENIYNEAPHVLWHLSEIVAPIVNGDATIKHIFPDTNSKSLYAYNRFDKSGVISIQGYFEDLYYKSNGNIEKFLKDVKDIAIQNEDLLKKAY